MSITEESSNLQKAPAAAAHVSSHSGYLTEDTPVAVEPYGRPELPAEGMDVSLPLNDLSSDDDNDDDDNFHKDDADEAAGLASSCCSVGSLSLDDHLAVAAASASAASAAAGDEVSTTSAGTGASSTTRGRRPSFQQQAHRRPSQRRRSSATSFEMHDSLIFEELNKLVEDDTDSSDDEEKEGEGKDDGAKEPTDQNGTAKRSTAAAAAINNQEIHVPRSIVTDDANIQRVGRRGSSRSLASVIEDMELDNEGGISEQCHDGDDDGDNAKAAKKMPVVMQFEQRIFDRLEQQDDKRSLVRTRSEASLHSGRSACSASTGRQGTCSLRHLGDLPGSSPAASANKEEAAPSRVTETSTKDEQVTNNDRKNTCSTSTCGSGKNAASKRIGLKSWLFRGLGRKNN